MSATGRSEQRVTNDFYETPSECTEAIIRQLWGGKFDDQVRLAVLPMPKSIIDPGCGSGAISWVIRERFGKRVRLEGFDIDIGKHIRPNPPPYDYAFTHDLLNGPKLTKHYDAAIGNPPYAHAVEFSDWCFAHATYTVLLLRVNFLASAGRREWLTAHKPDIYVLSNRPSFAKSVSCINYASGKPLCSYHEMLPSKAPHPKKCPLCGGKIKVTGSDATEYAWFVWGPGLGGHWGYADDYSPAEPACASDSNGSVSALWQETADAWSRVGKAADELTQELRRAREAFSHK